MATKQIKKSPTAFFSLPLELRHHVYSYLHFDHLSDEVQIGRPSDPRINAELHEYYRLHCDKLRFWVNTELLRLPEKITPYLNLRKVWIHIEHYKYDRKAEERKRQLDIMRDNLKQFLAFLGTRYTRLPKIEVRFDDNGEYGCSTGGHQCPVIEYCNASPFPYGDPHWTGNEEEGGDEEEGDIKFYEEDDDIEEYDGEALKIVRYGPREDDWKTIYEYLLGPLYDTNIVFDEVDISYLEGIAGPPFLRERTTDRGWRYMLDKRKALCAWLRGERDDRAGAEIEDGTNDWIDDMLARVALDSERHVEEE